MFEQYKKAIESSNIVSKTDIHGIITFANDEFCNISGYSRDELIGKDHNIVRHPDVPDENFKKLWEVILAKKTYKGTVKNLAKDGSSFYVNTTIIPILDNNGDIEEFIAIRYDVTKEVELQLALDDKQKILFSQARFASLGQMIANIAHQWRQPLTELNLSLYSLKSALDQKSPEQIEACYQDAKETIKSMSQTIEDFQNFFNPNKNIEPFNPIDSLNDALAIMKKALSKEHITINTSLDTNIQIMGISNELTQIFINLLQNAKDAMSDIGDSEKTIYIQMSVEEDNIVITVQDSGHGIKEDILEKIFEPYFSTKHASKGTGLGLFMSRMIVQQSLGGTIYAKNNEQGALFTIKIPLQV